MKKIKLTYRVLKEHGFCKLSGTSLHAPSYNHEEKKRMKYLVTRTCKDEWFYRNSNFIMSESNDEPKIKMDKPKYLHELQDKYFELNGEKLKYREVDIPETEILEVNKNFITRNIYQFWYNFIPIGSCGTCSHVWYDQKSKIITDCFEKLLKEMNMKLEMRVNENLLKDEKFNFDGWIGECVTIKLNKLKKEDKRNLSRIVITYE